MANKTGLLLINTGSPDSCSTADVRAYLREFLMDERVLDIPTPLRAALVYGCILPFRPALSAAAYREIWTSQGSPLVVGTEHLAQRLRAETDMPVAVAMRYGSLTVEKALDHLEAAGVSDVVLIPMFPHYAMSSYESAVEHVRAAARNRAIAMTLDVVPPYFADPAYIDALATSARESLAGGVDHLLFSYHGMPVRHLRKVNKTCGDCGAADHVGLSAATCYRFQTIQTTELCANVLSIEADRFSISYQSRLGRDRWLEPSTVSELQRLAACGVQRLAVICPSFTVDCLETLEEIAVRGREVFLNSGGKEFQMIPALNDNPMWARALAHIAGSGCSVAAY